MYLYLSIVFVCFARKYILKECMWGSKSEEHVQYTNKPSSYTLTVLRKYVRETQQSCDNIVKSFEALHIKEGSAVIYLMLFRHALTFVYIGAMPFTILYHGLWLCFGEYPLISLRFGICWLNYQQKDLCAMGHINYLVLIPLDSLWFERCYSSAQHRHKVQYQCV